MSREKYQTGEIATVITIGTLIIIGVASLVSSVFLTKSKQTTKTKAQSCECVKVGNDYFLDPACAPEPYIPCTPSSPGGLCQCSGGKAAGPCGDVNPCGPEGESCTDKGYGAWKDNCTGSAENCPADAGVTYTYWCDGSKWRFQYPNCVAWCKPAYLTRAPTPAAGGPCAGKSPGEIINPSSAGTVPTGVEKGSGISGLESDKYYSCDGNQGVWVEMRAFCDQFGQIQWGPGSKTDKICAPPDINITKTPAGKFYITAGVEVKKSGDKINFNTTVTFNSTDCDGRMVLRRDGVQTALRGWNRGGVPPGPVVSFDFYPEHTGGTISLGPGEKRSISYQAQLRDCPRSTIPLEDGLSCEFGVSPYGIPWVRGAGCNLANYSDIAKITPLPTPKFQPQVTWAPPPAPKITLPPVIFKLPTTAPGTSTPSTKAVTGCPMSPGTYQFTDGNCYQCRYPFDSNPTKVICPTSAPPVAAPPAAAPPAAGGPIAISSTGGYCPDADPKVAYCSRDQPALGWEKTWMSCYNSWDSCWVPADKIPLYPTPVPEDWTVEVDDGFASWSDWITNTQVCDYVGEKSFLGINGMIVKNCRSPEYSLSNTPGKILLKYQRKTGVKTVMCTLGGVGRCIMLP